MTSEVESRQSGAGHEKHRPSWPWAATERSPERSGKMEMWKETSLERPKTFSRDDKVASPAS